MQVTGLLPEAIDLLRIHRQASDSIRRKASMPPMMPYAFVHSMISSLKDKGDEFSMMLATNIEWNIVEAQRLVT